MRHSDKWHSAIPGRLSLLDGLFMLNDPIKRMEKYHNEYGDIFKIYLMETMLVVSGIEAREHFLKTHADIFVMGELVLRKAGAGVIQGKEVLFSRNSLFNDGCVHDNQRKSLDSFACPHFYKALATKIITICDENIKNLQPQHLANIGNGIDLTSKVFFEIANRAIFNLELEDSLAAGYLAEDLKLVKGMNLPTQLRIPFGTLRRAEIAKRNIVNILKEPARRAIKNGNRLISTVMYGAENGREPSEDTGLAQLNLVFNTATNIPTLIATWVLYFLAENPLEQQKLIEHQYSLFKENDPQPISYPI